jgi:Domain of unknown function (DUF4926)
MESFELLDVVVLKEALPNLKLKKGEIGTITEVLDEDVFLVEFIDTEGVTYAMSIINAKFLLKLK